VEVVRVRKASPEGPAGVAVRVPGDRAADRQALARLAEVAGVEPAPREQPFRILVVEDNHHVVEMYEYALKKLKTSAGAVKVEVRFASNGHEALAKLAEGPADLVMADLYMPVMDGFTLVERLRADPKLAGLPIMVISAGGADARARVLELGVDVYLQKPVQFSDIMGTVRTLLRLGP
jgi:CheY-like chemotaxis protein